MNPTGINFVVLVVVIFIGITAWAFSSASLRGRFCFKPIWKQTMDMARMGRCRRWQYMKSGVLLFCPPHIIRNRVCCCFPPHIIRNRVRCSFAPTQYMKSGVLLFCPRTLFEIGCVAVLPPHIIRNRVRCSFAPTQHMKSGVLLFCPRTLFEIARMWCPDLVSKIRPSDPRYLILSTRSWLSSFVDFSAVCSLVWMLKQRRGSFVGRTPNYKTAPVFVCV